MTDVISIGELLIDFTCQKVDEQGYPTMEAHPGGAPANYLAALSKFGAKTAMIGKVGRDSFGELLLDTLEKCGIDNSGIVSTDEAFTTLAFVTLDKYGDREFSFARKPGADTCLRFEEINLGMIENSRVLHFGTLSFTAQPSKEATEKAVRFAKERKKLVSFDPNLRKPIWNDLNAAREAILWGLNMADVVKISDDEVEFAFGLTAEKGAALIEKEYKVPLVFVTCGSKGAYYHTSKCHGFVPCPSNLNVIDTTGAGDIFGGSAMYMILESGKKPEDLDDDELRRITSFSCASASLSTQRYGSLFSVPDIGEIYAKIGK